MKRTVISTTIAVLALIGAVSPAAAYHGTVDVDECGDGCAKPQEGAEVLGIELID